MKNLLNFGGLEPGLRDVKSESEVDERFLRRSEENLHRCTCYSSVTTLCRFQFGAEEVGFLLSVV